MATSTTSTDRVEITSGPSKGRLIDALKYAFGESVFTVVFYGRLIIDGEIANSVIVLKAQITGLVYEDGKGSDFMVTANIVNHQNDPTLRGRKTFYYTTRGNTGTLRLTQ